jgi:hypothetical protein
LTKLSSKSCKNIVESVKPVLKRAGNIFSICCKYECFDHTIGVISTALQAGRSRAQFSMVIW